MSTSAPTVSLSRSRLLLNSLLSALSTHTNILKPYLFFLSFIFSFSLFLYLHITMSGTPRPYNFRPRDIAFEIYRQESDNDSDSSHTLTDGVRISPSSSEFSEGSGVDVADDSSDDISEVSTLSDLSQPSTPSRSESSTPDGPEPIIFPAEDVQRFSRRLQGMHPEFGALSYQGRDPINGKGTSQ